MFQRAVELDPDFALAWGELAQAHARLYHWGWDLTPNRRAMARDAAQRALSFDTDAPEMHRCLGYYYYWAYKDYEKALDELLLAEAELPSNAEVVEGLALVLRRMGKFAEALNKYLKAFELSPLEVRIPTEIGNSYVGLRQYPEALYFWDKAIELSPDDPFPYVYKAIVSLVGEGLPDKAREAMSNVPSIVDPYITWTWFMIETTSGDNERALEIISSYPLDYIVAHGAFYPIALLKATIHMQMGQPEIARNECDEALIILEREKVRRPQDPRVRSALGLAYAVLGRKEEAIREGRYVIDELFPLSLDAMVGPQYIFDMAHIYVVAEEYEAAIEQLEVLLSIPNAFSARYLEISPLFAPLRDHPRFQELLKKYN